MPEVIEEYVQILISKNTYERLQELDGLIPSPTCDSIISNTLLKLDLVAEGCVLFFDFEEQAFQILPIDEFIQNHKREAKHE